MSEALNQPADASLNIQIECAQDPVTWSVAALSFLFSSAIILLTSCMDQAGVPLLSGQRAAV